MPLSPMAFRPALGAAALVLAAALAGCGSTEMRFAPACPQLALLADGADLTRFAGPGRDVTDRVLEARLTGIEGACRPGRGTDVVASLKVQAELRRGPAAQGRQVTVPYFIAVMDGDTVLDRQAFAIQGAFPANVDSLRVAADELELRFAGAGDRGAGRYRVIVSLQLTEEELAYNRRGGPR